MNLFLKKILVRGNKTQAFKFYRNRSPKNMFNILQKSLKKCFYLNFWENNSYFCKLKKIFLNKRTSNFYPNLLEVGLVSKLLTNEKCQIGAFSNEIIQQII